jgi:hypothetical protein
MKPNINSVEVHPQLSPNGHPVDDVLVSAGLLCGWPGFQVEDDPENVKKCWKMSENVQSLFPPRETNLCALEEPTNAMLCLLCLPKLTTSEYLDACFD